MNEAMKPLNLENIEIIIFSRQRQPLMIVENQQEIRLFDRTDHGNGDTYGISEWYQINEQSNELPTGHYNLIEYIFTRTMYDQNFLNQERYRTITRRYDV